MRPDRPLILSVLLLGFGLGLIFGYCHGTAGVSVAYPWSGCSVRVCTTTMGPGGLGGLTLAILGAALLIWSLILALLSQMRLILPGRRPLARAEEAQRADRPPE